MSSAVGNIYTYKLSSWCDGQLGLNVLYYRVSAITSPQTDGSMVAALDNLFAPLLIPMLSSDAIYLGSSIQQIWPIPPALSVKTVLNQANGTGGTEVIPKQSALVITKLTNFAGRGFRGRMYVPFAPEAYNTTNGVPTAGYLALADSLAIQMISNVTVAGTVLVPIIYHRNVAGTYTVIQNYRVNARWGTQRRRGDYGRLNPQVPA